MTSILEAVKSFITGYNGLDVNAGFYVNYLENEPISYSIVPVPSNTVVETYLDDSSLRQYVFALQTMFSTDDEAVRIENSGFFEAFSTWLETQTKDGTFPTLVAGKTPEKIEALNQAFLMQTGQSGTGIYQIQCRLEYSQAAP